MACIAAYGAPALVHNANGQQGYPSYQNAYNNGTAYSSGQSCSITTLPAQENSTWTNTSGTGGTIATSVSPTAGTGHCLIVLAFSYRTTGLTISDNRSDSYTTVDTHAGTSGYFISAYLNNVPSGVTTVNVVDAYGASGDGVVVVVREYNNVQSVAGNSGGQTTNGSTNFGTGGFSFSASKTAVALGGYTQNGSQTTTVDTSDGWGNFSFAQNTAQPSTFVNSETSGYMEDAAASVTNAYTNGSRHAFGSSVTGFGDVILLTALPTYYTCISSTTGHTPPNATYWVAGDSATATITSTTANNTLVVIIADLQNKATVGVIDTNGDTFTAINSDGGTKGIYAYYCSGIAAGTTKIYLQTSNTAASNVSYQINEYSGLAAASPFDNFVTASGSSATVATTGFTYAQAKELVISAGAYTYTTSPTVDSGHGFGNFYNATYGSAGTADNCFVQDQNSSSTTGINSSNTVSASATWASIQIAFKASAASNVHNLASTGAGG